jgi:hypothetical protein
MANGIMRARMVDWVWDGTQHVRRADRVAVGPRGMVEGLFSVRRGGGAYGETASTRLPSGQRSVVGWGPWSMARATKRRAGGERQLVAKTKKVDSTRPVRVRITSVHTPNAGTCLLEGCIGHCDCSDIPR